MTRGPRFISAVVWLSLIAGIVLGSVAGFWVVSADTGPVTAERTIDTETIAPGEPIEVTLSLEIEEPIEVLDVIEEVEPQVLEAGTGIDEIEAPYHPLLADAGTTGLAIFWDEEPWERGETVSVSYTLNTSPTLESGDEVLITGASEVDGAPIQVDGPTSVAVETPRAPPTDVVSNLSPSTVEITEGEVISDIAVDIKNEGEHSETSTATLTVTNATSGDRVAVAERNVTIEAGSTERVTFADIADSSLSAGEYDVVVSTANDSISGSVVVTPPEQAGDDGEEMASDAERGEEADEDDYIPGFGVIAALVGLSVGWWRGRAVSD